MNNKKYKFAFFTEYLEGEDYSEPLWNYISNTCEELDIDLYIFPVRNVCREFGQRATFHESLHFINLDLFDGIILTSSAMMSALDESILHSNLEKLNSLPHVSIGNYYDDVSSSFIDNNKGMEFIFNNLLKKHGIKRIGYLGGQKENEESNQRLEAIRRISKINSVILKEDDIFYDYLNPLNIDSILAPLLDGRIKFLDALICGNDSIASAAIDLLKQNNIKIPKDIIVTGFDNNRPSRFQDSSITTISQSLDKLAKSTVNQLIKRIEGNTSNIETHIEPSLVVNQSYGGN